MTYLLDANVFIQAKNLHYGLDFCPAFWDWLDREHAAGTVMSVERVGTELQGVADQLATWAAARPGLFMPPDSAVVTSLQVVAQWAVSSARYSQAAISTFLQVADYYLIAQAHSRSDIVVTHEIPDNANKRIKIPNACIDLGVRCMTPFEMLRLERARFVLGR